MSLLTSSSRVRRVRSIVLILVTCLSILFVAALSSQEATGETPPPDQGAITAPERALFHAASGAAADQAGSSRGSASVRLTLQERSGAWSDNFDSYPTGASLHGLGGWKGWFNDPSLTAYTSDEQAASAPNSVEIEGAADIVHEFSGYTSGQWLFSGRLYVPTNFSGQSYLIFLNTYQDNGTNNNWSSQIWYTDNEIGNDTTGATIPLVRGQWLTWELFIDLDQDLQSFYVDDVALYTDQSWKDGLSGGGALNIATINLFANGASPVYHDDLSLALLGGVTPTPTVTGTPPTATPPPPTVTLPPSATPPPTGGQLVLDDGTSENGIGLTAGGSFLWFNRFTPHPDDYPFTLETVEVLFGSDSLCAVGDAMDIHVWTDPDGDPNNGALYLGGTSGTVQVLDAFSTYPVGLILPGPGDILIGVINRGCAAPGQYPAAIDQTTSQGRSWVTLYQGDPCHPPSLPAPTQGTIDEFGFPGNWIIRGYGVAGGPAATPTSSAATATPEPACPTAIPTATPGPPTMTPTASPTRTPTPTVDPSVSPSATATTDPTGATPTGAITSVQLGTLASQGGGSTPWLLLALVGVASLAGAAWRSARRRR